MVALAWAPWSLVLVLGSLDRGAAWDYQKNGADWGKEGQCGAQGIAQSPIDLPTSAEVAKESAIYLKYPRLTETIPFYHNGYSIAATLPETVKGGFSISDLGPGDWKVPELEAYRLWQINFHSPSEHTINGERMPLEVQLMHKRVTGGSDQDSELAVIAVLFQATPNEYVPFLDGIISNGLPQRAWDQVQVNAVTTPLEIGKLVGGSPYFTYKGSLTVPPCESSVKYFVRQEPVSAARAQLKHFERVLGQTCGPNGNFRLAKPLAGPLHLMASVDLVNKPDLRVKPREEKKVQAFVRPQPATDFEFACQKTLDNFAHDSKTLMNEDSDEMIKAKEAYSEKESSLQAALNAKKNLQRSETNNQKAFDSAPGMVSKFELKWQVMAADEAGKATDQGLAPKTKAHDQAKEALVSLMIGECVAKLKKKEEAAKKQKFGSEKVAAEAAMKKAQQEAANKKPHKFKYPGATLNLPVGVDESPFAKGSGSAGKAGSSAAMIAPNLQQPEGAPGGTVSAAEGEASGEVAETVANPNVLISMKLPIPLAKLSATKLIEALAKSAGVNPKRLEVKETHAAKVKKVQQTVIGLVQSSSHLRGT